MKTLILASKSPRRDEILTMVGLKHEIIVSDAEENVPEGTPAAKAAELISKIKAEAVLNEIRKNGKDFVIVAADTVVDIDGRVYGKPRDHREAYDVISLLSGRSHFVHTGITVTDGTKTVSETVTTKVKFRQLSEKEIRGYADSDEPMDKAGSYGIQGVGGAFVEHLEGDYFNVMGLPVCRLCEILTEFGISIY